MMKKKSKKLLLWLFVLTFVLTGIAGCGTKQKDDQEAASTETAGAISSVDDIVGKKIGVQLGTTGDIYVSDYENDGSGTTVERYNKGADAVQALKQGKIDCVVIDEQPALAFVEENPGLKILDEEFTLEEYAIVIAKGNDDLLEKVNTALEELRSEGTLDRITKNYIGTDAEKGNYPYEPQDVSRGNGTLTMGTNAEFPPYEYYENNEIVGIDVDIMQAIADKLGMELKIEDMAFDSIIPAVQSGKADIGAAGMTVTEDRATQVDFSDSYYTGVQVIIVTDDSDITGPDDLKGKKIGVQQGTTGDIYSTDDFGDDNVERFNKGMEAVQALQQGKIDAVIIDNQPAKTFVEENESLKILETSYVEEDYALAIKKGNDDLVKKVNDAIKELKEDGTFDEIVAKYITD